MKPDYFWFDVAPVEPRTIGSAADDGPEFLRVDVVAGLAPLDAQIGAMPKKSLPAGLVAPLFGDADPMPHTATPLRTYAVLDAARLPNVLPMLLESSGLRFASLFQGTALDDLGAISPYLVELTADAPLTRQLFTGPDGVNGLCHHGLGIFVRAQTEFDEVRRHLRKFTRARNPRNRGSGWVLVRFWEPAAAAAFWVSFADDEAEVARRFGAGRIDSVAWIEPRFDDRFDFVTVTARTRCEAPTTPADVLSRYAEPLRQARWRGFCRKVVLALAREFGVAPQRIAQATLALCVEAREQGYRREAAVHDYVRARVMAQRGGLDFAAVYSRLASRPMPDDLSGAAALRRLVEAELSRD